MKDLADRGLSSRRDRARWAAASSLADLGELTAQWLEGRVVAQPGYAGPVDVDEAEGLRAALVACNRAGFVTTNSQAGYVGPGYDGAGWEQSAWVTGFAEPGLVARLCRAAADHPSTIAAYCLDPATAPLVVTRCAGRPHTRNGWIDYRTIGALIYPGVGRAALLEVLGAQQLVVLDHTPGRNDLWAWLTTAIVEQPDNSAVGWRSGATHREPVTRLTRWTYTPVRTETGMSIHPRIPAQRERGWLS